MNFSKSTNNLSNQSLYEEIQALKEKIEGYDRLNSYFQLSPGIEKKTDINSALAEDDNILLRHYFTIKQYLLLHKRVKLSIGQKIKLATVISKNYLGEKVRTPLVMADLNTSQYEECCFANFKQYGNNLKVYERDDLYLLDYCYELIEDELNPKRLSNIEFLDACNKYLVLQKGVKSLLIESEVPLMHFKERYSLLLAWDKNSQIGSGSGIGSFSRKLQIVPFSTVMMFLIGYYDESDNCLCGKVEFYHEQKAYTLLKYSCNKKVVIRGEQDDRIDSDPFLRSIRDNYQTWINAHWLVMNR